MAPHAWLLNEAKKTKLSGWLIKLNDLKRSSRVFFLLIARRPIVWFEYNWKFQDLTVHSVMAFCRKCWLDFWFLPTFTNLCSFKARIIRREIYTKHFTSFEDFRHPFSLSIQRSQAFSELSALTFKRRRRQPRHPCSKQEALEKYSEICLC